jgi:hypothetical protein
MSGATTPREHAIRASVLVGTVEETAGTHPPTPINAYRLELALAHAVVALALCYSEEEPTADDAEDRFST